MCGQNGPGPARAWAALTFKHSANTLHLSFTEFIATLLSWISEQSDRLLWLRHFVETITTIQVSVSSSEPERDLRVAETDVVVLFSSN